MNNFFITQSPFAKPRKSRLANYINWVIKKLGYGYKLERLPDGMVDMNSVEQRMNYCLLLDSVISNEIEGDVAELGCFTGQCAMLFEKVIEQTQSLKKLHLYDSFETKFAFTGNVEEELLNNFKLAKLRPPVLHKGYFNETLPTQLSGKLAFVHIDCGFGGDTIAHRDVMIYCLENIYPKLSKGAICMLMDYHNDEDGDPGLSVNPGVKLACDVFLKDKPEYIISLYAKDHCHGFFRKT
ncbi:O-methyltransferase [Pedobacter sp. UYP30]|uniref:TylF/MycF/NovP-related O-methyltransferase n=1 Tax=Pedobacter sp. UYP30 TaxID=1756400 RepID=UPI0033999709